MIVNTFSLITTINHFHLSSWNTAAQTAALAFGKTEGVEQKRQKEPSNTDLLPAQLKLFPKRTDIFLELPTHSSHTTYSFLDPPHSFYSLCSTKHCSIVCLLEHKNQKPYLEQTDSLTITSSHPFYQTNSLLRLEDKVIIK